MQDRFQRTRMLLGGGAMDKLKNSHVIVFGIGGVGGYVVEALVRSGIGRLTLVDSDTVAFSNLNRQIIATESTVGMPKTLAAKERAMLINPECDIITRDVFYTPETEGEFDFSQYDYIVDAIDTVSGKISMAVRAQETGVPIISAMGAGNKLDPSRLEVSDIYKTSVCPLARVMRHELRKRGVKKLKVVYSKEEPTVPEPLEQDGVRRSVPGSTAFVPSAAGLIMAAEIVRDLTENERKSK